MDRSFALDASSSRDLSYNPGTGNLTYSWTCRFTSTGPRFGDSCGLITSSNSSSSTIAVGPYRLSLNETYSFSVQVEAGDGRSDSESVLVYPTFAGSMVLFISSSSSRINLGDRLVLHGNINTFSDVVVSWSGLFSGISISLDSTTPLQETFHGSPTQSTVVFPFSTQTDDMLPNREYTFRLSACFIHSLLNCSYVDYAAVFHSGPLGGSIVSSPSHGLSYSTTFTLASKDWVEEIDAYPLMFEFFYRLADSFRQLALSSLSVASTVQVELPPGRANLGHNVTIINSAYNVFGAATTVYATVTVLDHPINTTDVFSAGALSFLQTGDVDTFVRTINNIAVAIGSTNCSSAPDCASLHRNDCLLVSNTCGDCAEGYLGVVGSSNVPCFSANASAQLKQADETCASDLECFFQQCTDGTCVVPLQTCKTNLPGTPCSGHGVCSFSSVSGELWSTACHIVDVYCTAKCICDTGYAGDDCFLTEDEFASLDNIRASMCDSLVLVTTQQSSSSQFLQSMASSLSQTYSSAGSTSLTTVESCSNMLTYLTSPESLATYKDVSRETFQLLTQIIASFVITPATNVTSGIAESALGLMIAGILTAVVHGEAPIVTTSGSVQLSVQQPLVTSLSNQSLSAPQTAAQSTYGAAQPTLSLGSQGFSQCGFGERYVQLSLAQWSSSPFAGTSNVQTPVLR